MWIYSLFKDHQGLDRTNTQLVCPSMAQLVVNMEIFLTDRNTATALTPEPLPPLSPSFSTILRDSP